MTQQPKTLTVHLDGREVVFTALDIKVDMTADPPMSREVSAAITDRLATRRKQLLAAVVNVLFDRP